MGKNVDSYLLPALIEAYASKATPQAARMPRGIPASRVFRGVRTAENNRSRSASALGSVLLGRVYRTGDRIPASGIYQVAEHADHDEPFSTALVIHESFPRCAVCEQEVVYRLVHAAPYIRDDEDFRKHE